MYTFIFLKSICTCNPNYFKGIFLTIQDRPVQFETISTIDESLIGRYIVVVYDGEPYPRVVLSVDEDDIEVKVESRIE